MLHLLTALRYQAYGKSLVLNCCASSNFSQVCFRLPLPVNLRPKPFSPSRTTVPPSSIMIMTKTFPVVVSLNLSPGCIMATSPPFFQSSSRRGREELRGIRNWNTYRNPCPLSRNTRNLDLSPKKKGTLAHPEKSK